VAAIQNMMFAAGDTQEASPYCAVLIKDAVGEWMRQVTKKFDEAICEQDIAHLFPQQYAVFHRWFRARRECKDSVQEDGEESEEVEDWVMADEEIVADKVIAPDENDGKTEEDDGKEDVLPASELKIPMFEICIGGRKRLEHISKRTLRMSSQDYQVFSSSRTISFLKKNQKSSFCKWIGFSANSSSFHSLLVYFFAYLAWDRVASLVETALGLRIWILYKAERIKYKSVDIWLEFSEWGKVPLRIVEISESIRVLNYFSPPPSESLPKRELDNGQEPASLGKRAKI
jgi:hypothetical protein